MDKLLYISTGLPKEQVDDLRQKQIDFSSNAMLPISVFHGNVLSGLSESYDEVEALSGVPINHKLFKILRYSSKKVQKGNIHYILPGFFNAPVLKQFTMIVKMWLHIIRWYHKNKAHNCNIIIDGTFYSGLISLGLASKFVNVKRTAILVDYYSFMDPVQRSFSQKLYYRLLKCIDSFVFVTDHLEKLVNREGKQYIIMEGLVSAQHTGEDTESVENYCMYAGGLHEIYGVKNLIDAFCESDIPYSLHLYGNGDMVEYIKEAGKKDGRIVYKGILSHDQLLQVERSAKLLVNPRPVRGKLDTRFNFPSKLMEFMQSGRPVITTKLLGIPKEYDHYMYYFEDDTKDKIREGLQKVLSIEEQTLSSFGQRARNYVNENKNSIAVGKRIFSMINMDGELANEESN